MPFGNFYIYLSLIYTLKAQSVQYGALLLAQPLFTAALALL